MWTTAAAVGMILHRSKCRGFGGSRLNPTVGDLIMDLLLLRIDEAGTLKRDDPLGRMQGGQRKSSDGT